MICNFVDYNTLCSYNKNINLVFLSLKYNLKNVLDWFKINFIKVTLGKFQFMIFGVDNIVPLNLLVTGKSIPYSSEVRCWE